MANIRTLKLNLLADTDNFSKGIKKATGQSESFAKKLGKNFAIAGAAIGGAAIALGIDAVKAAIDDQKSQKQLALALKNTTKATNAQIKASEKWINSQQLAYGVADDELRPALAKLVRVTGDVKKSQDLLSLAMDISAGAGVSLETATNAVVKAQQGQFKGLKTLGVPLSDTIIKNKDLGAALKVAEDRFKGAAKAGAETLNGKLVIFNKSMGEAKEAIGTAILTALQPLAEKWLPKIATGVQHFLDGLMGTGENGGLNGAIKDGQDGIYEFGEKTRGFFKFLKDNQDTLKRTAILIGSIFIGSKAGAAVGLMVTALQTLRGAFVRTTAVAATTAAAEAAATGGGSLLVAAPAIGAIIAAFGAVGLMGLLNFKPKKKKKNSGAQGFSDDYFGGNLAGAGLGEGDVDSNGMVWFNGKKVFYRPYMSQGKNRDLLGRTKPKAGMKAGEAYRLGGPQNFRQSGNSGNQTIINLNGIVDAESARRSIEALLQSSSIRTGAVNLNRAVI